MLRYSVISFVFFFFFSSRRRHTRSDRDWSSDVCSSDLLGLKIGLSSLLEEANGIGFHTRTGVDLPGEITPEFPTGTDRKSTRLNSSHDQISYAVFCLKKKKIRKQQCE